MNTTMTDNIRRNHGAGTTPMRRPVTRSAVHRGPRAGGGVERSDEFSERGFRALDDAARMVLGGERRSA